MQGLQVTSAVGGERGVVAVYRFPGVKKKIRSSLMNRSLPGCHCAGLPELWGTPSTPSARCRVRLDLWPEKPPSISAPLDLRRLCWPLARVGEVERVRFPVSGSPKRG